MTWEGMILDVLGGPYGTAFVSLLIALISVIGIIFGVWLEKKIEDWRPVAIILLLSIVGLFASLYFFSLAAPGMN